MSPLAVVRTGNHAQITWTMNNGWDPSRITHIFYFLFLFFLSSVEIFLRFVRFIYKPNILRDANRWGWWWKFFRGCLVDKKMLFVCPFIDIFKRVLPRTCVFVLIIIINRWAMTIRQQPDCRDAQVCEHKCTHKSLTAVRRFIYSVLLSLYYTTSGCIYSWLMAVSWVDGQSINNEPAEIRK